MKTVSFKRKQPFTSKDTSSNTFRATCTICGTRLDKIIRVKNVIEYLCVFNGNYGISIKITSLLRNIRVPIRSVQRVGHVIK